MADTGWLNPSACGVTYNDWTNPTNAYSNNGTYTVSNTSSDDNDQDYYNFAIPDLAGNIINGIEVSMEAYDSTYMTTWTCQCKLSWDGGSTYTSGINQTWNAWSFSPAYASWGSATELWGRVWNYPHLTDANFRVYLNTTGGRSSDGLYADHVRVKVYYTAGTTSSSSTSTTSTSTSTTTTTHSTSSTSISTTSHSTSTTSTSTTSTSRSTSSTSSSSISTSTTSTSTTSTSTSTSMTGTTTSTSTTSTSSSSSTSTTTLMYKPSADIYNEKIAGDSLRV